MRLGDLDSAEENYNKAHTLRPHSDALHVNMGSLWYFRVDLRKAFEHFKMAVDINPYNDRAWCGVALVARDKKDKVWAKEMILKSLDINPVNLVALQQLVSWALEDKEYKNAIERVMLYTFEVQNDVSMMYTLAGLLFQSGQVLEAELELERILTLDPLHESALQLLDLIHGREVQK
jgi:tetratricopeptide (TPR) repeat protein